MKLLRNPKVVVPFIVVFSLFVLLCSFSLLQGVQIRVNLLECFSWLSDNWLLVALILSEIAGFTPGKVKGFISGLLEFGNRHFLNKKLFTKNFNHEN